MDSQPFKLIIDSALQFIFLFSNADGFYISARYNLINGWEVPGCSNAHQSIELYIKAILKLNHEQENGHDLIKLLSSYENREEYFTFLLNSEKHSLLLKELSDAYLLFRYGEAGAESNVTEIVKILDEIVYKLRLIYLENIKNPSKKIYIPDSAKQDFLKLNDFFSEEDITNNPLAKIMPMT